AARTINGNMEDQIWYAHGADIVLRQDWVDDKPPVNELGEAPLRINAKVNYLEPDFVAFGSLPGVQHTARVFVKEHATASFQRETNPVRLVGIHTEEFGLTSWMKEGLLAHHFYDYLNLIAPDPRAVLISPSLAEALQVHPGD